MIIGRRGKDLAIRIPKRLVEQYGLKVGDTIDADNLAANLQKYLTRRSETK